MFRISAVMILLFTGMAVVPQLFFTHSLDPQYCVLSNTTQPPSRAHWFGTDILGCDYYTRVVYGTRTSFEVGILVSAGIVVLSLTLGGAAGFFGGTTDIADTCAPRRRWAHRDAGRCDVMSFRTASRRFWCSPRTSSAPPWPARPR
jgi:hypothetical protein